MNTAAIIDTWVGKRGKYGHHHWHVKIVTLYKDFLLRLQTLFMPTAEMEKTILDKYSTYFLIKKCTKTDYSISKKVLK